MLRSVFWARPNKMLVLLTVASAALASSSHASTAFASEDEISTEQKYDFLAASIGDSITAAMDADRPLANREINWATGTKDAQKVNSHALRLRAALPDKKIATRNLAISGSKSPDVVRQAAHLAKSRPDYVTVLVGANDVCAWDEDHSAQLEAYEDNMRKIMATLVKSNNDVKVLVSAIPNMPLLRDLGAANGCQSRWSTLNICPALLGAKRTDEERAGFARRWADANDVLEKVSAEFPQNVRFAASAAQPVFNMGHVSKIDCFHPNVNGQDFLAEMTWAEGWY